MCGIDGDVRRIGQDDDAQVAEIVGVLPGADSVELELPLSRGLSPLTGA